MGRRFKLVILAAVLVAVAAGVLVTRIKEPWEGTVAETFDTENPDIRAHGYGEPWWHFRLFYLRVTCDDGKERVVKVPYRLWQRAAPGSRVRQPRFGRYPDVIGEPSPQ